MQIEGQVSNKLRLRHARAQLGLTQERLSKLARVSEVTMVKAEKGGTIGLLTAQAILNALNTERDQRNLPPFTLSDLEWSVQGE